MGLLKKLNFFVEEDIRKELDELVPAGQKSKIINKALRKELLRIRREKVTEKLALVKSRGPKDAEKILEILLEYEFKEMKITKDVTSRAFALMREYRGVTFYDTIYHAVAIRKRNHGNCKQNL